jgi:hypothetical protein
MQSESVLPHAPSPTDGVPRFAALPPWPAWQPRLAVRARGAGSELLLTTGSMTAAIARRTGRTVHVRWSAGPGRAPAALDPHRPAGWLRHATLFAGSEPVLVACSWFPGIRAGWASAWRAAPAPSGRGSSRNTASTTAPSSCAGPRTGGCAGGATGSAWAAGRGTLEFVVVEHLLPALYRP